MTRDVTVAMRDTTLEEVARMMRDEDTGVIPVVEPGETSSDSVTEVQRVPARTAANGKLVGLITDRDIVIRAVADGMDVLTLRAEEVMTIDLYTVRPNDRVIEAIEGAARTGKGAACRSLTARELCAASSRWPTSHSKPRPTASLAKRSKKSQAARRSGTESSANAKR